jgi:hypothetical protein
MYVELTTNFNSVKSEKAVAVTDSISKETAFVRIYNKLTSSVSVGYANSVKSEKAVAVTDSISKETAFVRIYNKLTSSVSVGYANSVNYLGSKSMIKTIYEFWS